MGFEGVCGAVSRFLQSSHIMQRRKLLEDFNGEFEINFNQFLSIAAVLWSLLSCHLLSSQGLVIKS